MKDLSPEDLKALASACMNDPDFASAMLANNPDLAKSMAELAKDAEGSQSTSDALLDSALTAEEKKAALSNGIGENGMLANALDEAAQLLLNDPALAQQSVGEVKDAVDASSDEQAKSDFDSITSAETDPLEIMKECHKKESLKLVCKDVFAKCALKSLDGMTDAQLEAAFLEIGKNPALAKALLDANPDLADSVALMKDPNAIYGPNGLPIDMNVALTREVVDKFTELTPIDDATSKFSSKPELTHTLGQGKVVDMSDPENPVF
mmetsp:Transcript_50659/g.42688  ORF Transcript_50659/g.42688 Transcript_50659/m.42688 type:complete len:265 (-) Transcript_50659:1664-2458(-)